MNQNKVIRQSIVGILFAALMGVGPAASAYTPGACRQDGMRLCPDAKTDKELTPCLKQHEAELSNDCKVNLAEARETVRQVKDACADDIATYCKGVEQGKGRIRRCLNAHEAQLSSGCKTQIAETRKRYQAILPPPTTSTMTVPPGK